jgi:hypothetical protein
LNPVLVAADAFNEGTGAPAQAMSIHLAYMELLVPATKTADAVKVDIEVLRPLCGEWPPGKREQIAAPLDHPAFCARCRAARPHSVGSLVRVVTIAVISQ